MRERERRTGIDEVTIERLVCAPMNERKIYCCVYLSDRSDKVDASRSPVEYQQFVRERPPTSDVGDDPSFFCATRLKGPVTWGICRHNVRNILRNHDEIHFVLCDKTNRPTWEYYYVGHGVVATTITHEEIFTKSEFRLFREYFNTLLEPRGKRFIHFEKLPLGMWHDDWVMRLSSVHRLGQLDLLVPKTPCGIREAKTKHLEGVEFLNSKVPLGSNYIVFDQHLSRFSLEKPLHLCTLDWRDRYRFASYWHRRDLREALFPSLRSNGEFTNASRQHVALKMSGECAYELKEAL